MAASDMMSALMELCQEKHIDQLYLIDRLEQSLAKSYAEILHLEWGAKVTIDRTTGKIYVYRLEPIDDSMDEEGNFTEFEEIDVTPKNTSRIAAQHAKAEINAIVRNSAREQIYEEFSGRIGDLISGTVLQSTPDFTIVKIREGVEAELPHFDQRRYENERNERPGNEHYRHNQRLKVLIIDVRDPNSDAPKMRGEQARPAIVVSRTHPDLIRRLFEMHGFSHPGCACVNAEKVFHITKKEQSIISSHMWPLTFRHVPSCREAIIVCLADKYCAVVESMFKRSRVAAAKNANGEYDEW